MMNNEYILLVDSNIEDLSILDETDKKFLFDKGLIEIYPNGFIPKFVGEILTPENKYFSLPKNFDKSHSNVDITKKLIEKYRQLRDDTGKLVLTNNVFKVKSDGVIKSEKVYFNNLKDFFLDYITYEFIYPKKKKVVHTNQIIKGGKIDVLKTVKNRKRFGLGTTYKVKDAENTKDWNLDDIYYHTLNKLAQEYGTNKDIKDIEDMKKYLISEGYVIRDLEYDKSNEEEFYKKIIKDINKCDVGIIHQPIKNTLLNYYKFKKIGEYYSLNLFYTKRFEYVWEHTIRIVLKDDIETRNRLKINPRKFLKYDIDTGKYYMLEEERRDIPDIVSKHDNKIFIGDAKYYKDVDSRFDKEQYRYNNIFNSIYPIVALIPYNGETKTERIEDPKKSTELFIIKLSVKDVLNDLVNGTNRCINRIQTLIKKNTDRW